MANTKQRIYLRDIYHLITEEGGGTPLRPLPPILCHWPVITDIFQKGPIDISLYCEGFEMFLACDAYNIPFQLLSEIKRNTFFVLF